MNRQEYTDKVKILLEDANTYWSLSIDPTNKQEAKLINILKGIKAETGIEDITYKEIYPTGAS